MKILLDSHAFVWAKCSPLHFSETTRSLIISPANEVHISVASAWELWIKNSKKPIKGLADLLTRGPRAFRDAAEESGIELLQVTLEHAAAAAALPQIHRDPFDRMIIAQAIQEHFTVITADNIFSKYRGLRVLEP